MGECTQGLVLLGNQRLLFVELGGFVNNAFSMSPECVPAGKRPLTHTQFLFVGFFFLFVFFLMGCLWIRVIRRIIAM